MKTALTKTSPLLLLALLILSPIAALGGSGSHGGIGVEIDNQLYLLDLAERRVENDVNVVWGDGSAPLVDYHSKDTDQTVTLVTEEGQVVRHVLDTPGLPRLHGFLNKSTAQNDYMFGKALPNVCENCYSAETALSIALLNSRPDYLESAAFAQMKWILVRTPLKLSEDEHSPMPDYLKFMIAARDKNFVRISEYGWSKPIAHHGASFRPLNPANRVALISHEILYFITEHQGDLDSDRARALNAKKWTKWRVEEYYENAVSNDYWVTLTNVPGHPSPNPVLLSELAPGSELTVLKDLPVGGTRSLTLVPGYAPMTEEYYWQKFYPFDSGYAQFFYRHSQFTNFGVNPWPLNYVLRKGTTHRVQSVWVDVGNSDMKATVTLDPAGGSDMMYITVKAPRKGSAPTVADFESMIRGNMQLTPKH